MSTASPVLPTPTIDRVKDSIRQYDQTRATVENALSSLFTQFPDNENRDHILFKVVTLNSLYHTGILDPSKVVDHIYSLNIDLALQSGDPELVPMIAKVKLSKGPRTFYSFATRYCSLHYPDRFPIYNDPADKALWGYHEQDHFGRFYHKDFLKYTRFKNILLTFQEVYHLRDFSFKEIDKYLWLTGKEYFPEETN
jgi:hypothetical protein